MGILRFLLAAAVVIWHSWGWGGFKVPTSFYPLYFLHPYYAVQAFFVISGFYMAVVLSEKYNRVERGTLLFYFNRYLRLAPTFWLVSLVTVGLIVAFPHNDFPPATMFSGRMKPEFPFPYHLGELYVVIANTTMIGHDWAHFLDPWTKNRTFTGIALISQAWSIGTELWFYMLAPFLVRLRTRWLLVLVGASVACRFITLRMGLPFWPWQQRFFPCELYFFLMGILAYRCYHYYQQMEKPWVLNPWLCRLATLLLCLGVSLVSWVKGAQHLTAWHSIGLGVVFFALLPFAFHATRSSRWDRLIGELSYPIYLWHICLGYFCHPAQVYGKGGLLLLLCVAVSVPTVLLLEHPVERWRQALLRGRKPRPAAGLAGPGRQPAAA